MSENPPLGSPVGKLQNLTTSYPQSKIIYNKAQSKPFITKKMISGPAQIYTSCHDWFGYLLLILPLRIRTINMTSFSTYLIRFYISELPESDSPYSTNSKGYSHSPSCCLLSVFIVVQLPELSHIEQKSRSIDTHTR